MEVYDRKFMFAFELVDFVDSLFPHLSRIHLPRPNFSRRGLRLFTYKRKLVIEFYCFELKAQFLLMMLSCAVQMETEEEFNAYLDKYIEKLKRKAPYQERGFLYICAMISVWSVHVSHYGKLREPLYLAIRKIFELTTIVEENGTIETSHW